MAKLVKQMKCLRFNPEVSFTVSLDTSVENSFHGWQTSKKNKLFYKHMLFQKFLYVGGFIFLSHSSISAKPIAVFYALEVDKTVLVKDAVQIGVPKTVGNRTISKYTLGQRTIVVVKMGAGPVQTAISASTLLATIPCSLAISIGPVGAINNPFKIGDWLVVNKMRPYQKGIWEGTHFSLNPKSFVDEPRLSLGEISQAQIDKIFNKPAIGTAASGEAFIASNTFRDQLKEMTKAEVVEMNLYGLESACQDFGVALLNIRIISDYADANAQADFTKFTSDYQGDLGLAVSELIKSLPPDLEDVNNYQDLKKLLGN